MADRLKSGSPEWLARQRRHFHNGLIGCCTMARQNMRAVMDCDSVRPEDRVLAQELYNKLDRLEYNIRNNRID